jgi:catechol 2,3-dioxygenase-like lactoylglutathione lyase family enzyme
VLVFDAGTVGVEVFICSGRKGPSHGYDHLCLTVEDRETLLERAASHGLGVNRFNTGDKEIVFLKDWDGNLYEIKQA